MLSFFLQAVPGQAQATRTWVSGVGDDVNPCSRTAPCKTFAGAISKTAAGGEISVLDPGGFGAVTITKSISITQDSSGEGGVLAALTNGVTINGAGIVVQLRGLIIEGAGNGLNGIRFLQGSALHIQDCVIRGFNGASPNGHGINFAPSTAAELYVQDTVISSNGSVAASTGGGVLIKPTGTGSANVSFTRVAMENNVFGIKADGNGSTGGIKVTLRDSVSTGNSFSGITAVTPGGGAIVSIMVDSTGSVNNGTGIVSDGLGATVRLTNATITGNGNGLTSLNSGTIASYSNNRINGNSADGAPTSFLNEN